jgi:hypothetical protein
MTDDILETNDDKVRAVFKARFGKNLSLSKAFEETSVASSTFYSVPEDVRLQIADEVRAEIVKGRQDDEDVQTLARQQMLLDLRKEMTDAALEALDTLRQVMRNAQSDFVKEKAAVDLLNYIERNFEGEARKTGEDDGQKQLQPPNVNVMLPIMAMPIPAQLQPVSGFTVVATSGEEKQIGAQAVIEGEFTENT